MTPNELMSRVTRDVCALGAALVLPAAWLGGAEGAVGAAAGAALAAGNFRWLSGHATSLAAAGRMERRLWSLGAGLRLGAVATACGVAMTSGLAHPVALVAGLTLLPCVLVVHGLRAARQED